MIYKGIRNGDIRLNEKKIKPETTTCQGDVLCINQYFAPDSEKGYKKKTRPRQQPGHESITTLIVFENKHILGLNKPSGLLVHGENSLEKRVTAYVKPHISRSLSFEPGPVNRLDRNTSGLIFFSKSLKGAQVLSELFKKNLCEKYYLGLFDGRIEQEEEWRDFLSRDKRKKKTFPAQGAGAQEAVTIVTPLFKLKRKTLALCMITTGVTHQIRAQGMIHGHPLTGDRKYRSGLPPVFRGRPILHSLGIRFASFYKIIGRTSIVAPLPQPLYNKLKSLCGAAHFKSTLSRTLETIRQGEKE
jgi:23S rRNA pseudouridine955/2504/2580 synthase